MLEGIALLTHLILLLLYHFELEALFYISSVVPLILFEYHLAYLVILVCYLINLLLYVVLAIIDFFGFLREGAKFSQVLLERLT